MGKRGPSGVADVGPISTPGARLFKAVLGLFAIYVLTQTKVKNFSANDEGKRESEVAV